MSKLLTDYPTAWAVMRKTDPQQHHERCSYRQTNGGVLCDCAASAAFIATVEMQDEQKSFSAKIIGTGDDATDAGIEKAYKHANPEWLEMALGVVHRACLSMREWSVNDIREEINASPIKTHSNYAMGGVMGAAKKNGWITQAKNDDGTPKKVMNTVGHLTTIQVWRSQIYTEAAPALPDPF